MGMHALPRTNVSFGWLEEAVANLHGRLYKPMMPRREWEVPGYRPSLRTSSLPTSFYIYSYRLLVWHSSGFLPSPTIMEALPAFDLVVRCFRCSRGKELMSTDDVQWYGYVKIGHNLFYCTGCADKTGYSE